MADDETTAGPEELPTTVREAWEKFAALSEGPETPAGDHELVWFVMGASAGFRLTLEALHAASDEDTGPLVRLRGELMELAEWARRRAGGDEGR